MPANWKHLLTAALLTSASIASHAATPQETVTAFHAALAAGDQSKASAFLAPDLLIFESGSVERSREEYTSHHMNEDIAFSRTGTRKVLRQGERISGNLAVVWEELETKGTIRGRDIQLLGTETTVLEKKGEEWVIVHAHWSSRKTR